MAIDFAIRLDNEACSFGGAIPWDWLFDLRWCACMQIAIMLSALMGRMRLVVGHLCVPCSQRTPANVITWQRILLCCLWYAAPVPSQLQLTCSSTNVTGSVVRLAVPSISTTHPVVQATQSRLPDA
jgi:hypothetical protein